MRVVISLAANPEVMLLLLDTDTGDIVHRVEWDDKYINNQCDDNHPLTTGFGITWDEDYIFVTNRLSLLVFDSEFNFVDRYDILDQNTHQITMWGDYMIACMTRKDCVSIINMDDMSSTMFHPDLGWGENFPTLGDVRSDADIKEKYHINSVTVKDDILRMLINRPSTVVSIDLLSMKMIDKQPVSIQTPSSLLDHNAIKTFNLCHNIVLDDNNMYVLTTNGSFVGLEGTLTQMRKTSMKDDGFTRGFAGTMSDYVIGQSDKVFKRSDRQNNLQAQSWLETNTNSIDMPIKGMIRDIRRTDGIDHGHHNKHLFPFKDAR